MGQRPFRFSVQATGAPLNADWAEVARKAEGLGFSSLTVADHFDGQFAPIPATMAAADATTTLRIGTLVLGNDFRHPAVTAKEAATVDVLSGGRFELGLGAGWMTTDYQQAGIPLDPATTRIERLAESAQIIRALLSDPEPVTFAGDHYQVTGLAGTPRPTQSPLPLLLAGGRRKVLSVAGRYGDIVGLNPGLAAGVIDGRAGATATAESTDEKLGWIRDAAGDRFDSIELQTRIHIAVITDDRQTVAESLAPALGITPAAALESPHALAGTVDQCVETIQRWRDRWGISYVGFSYDAMETFAPVVERLTGT